MRHVKPMSGAGVSLLVDARGIYASGIGRCLREVLSGVIGDARFARVVLLGSSEELGEYVASQGTPEHVVIAPYPGKFYSVRSQREWLTTRPDRRLRADVTLFPHYDAPMLRHPARSVVMIHDLIHFEVPEMFPAVLRAGAGVLLRRVAQSASRIIVPSENTRVDLIERVPGIDGKVEVVPYGVSEEFRPGSEADSVSTLTRSLMPYLLYVGNRKPHKNYVAAVEALAILHARGMTEVRLVVVGRQFGDDAEFRDRARMLGVAEAVIDLETVEDQQLHELYRSALALVFPSLYEGFGFPVLEAMASGTPVIASNRSSIPEVAGDAAILVDPHDHGAMADAAALLLNDPEARAARVAEGIAHAQKFGWDRMVQRTMELLIETSKVPSRHMDTGAREPIVR